MRKFEAGDTVYLVTDYGIIKCQVVSIKYNGNYDLVSYSARGGLNRKIFFDTKASYIYPPEDFGRACNYFKSRYGG